MQGRDAGLQRPWCVLSPLQLKVSSSVQRFGWLASLTAIASLTFTSHVFKPVLPHLQAWRT